MVLLDRQCAWCRVPTAEGTVCIYLREHNSRPTEGSLTFVPRVKQSGSRGVVLSALFVTTMPQDLTLKLCLVLKFLSVFCCWPWAFFVGFTHNFAATCWCLFLSLGCLNLLLIWNSCRYRSRLYVSSQRIFAFQTKKKEKKLLNNHIALLPSDHIIKRK